MKPDHCPVTGLELPPRPPGRRGAHQLYYCRAASEVRSAMGRIGRYIAAVIPLCDSTHLRRLRGDLIALANTVPIEPSREPMRPWSDRPGTVLVKARLPADLYERLCRLPQGTTSARVVVAVEAGLDAMDCDRT